MGQVLLNLAVNARDAVSGHGTLTITTRNEENDVVLEVVDDGAGMDEETRARVFEPFFTTKPVGHGTGLGLSTVYGIVAQSGGSIDVQGYEVAMAGSASEAHELEGPWDLLLTDVVMPETDGVHMSKDIDARHVMFISGYDQEALVAGDALFLQKPFSREALTRAVRALFNEERTAVRTLA